MPLQVELKKDGVKRMGFWLIRKLLSNKLVNCDEFTSLFPRIWRTMEDFEIEVISGNTFSFTFKTSNDRWQVLQGGPWSFDKALLIGKFLGEMIGEVKEVDTGKSRDCMGKYIRMRPSRLYGKRLRTGAGPIGATGPSRKKVAGGSTGARITPELETCRNLGSSLVKEDLLPAKVLVTNGSFLPSYNARIDDTMHGKLEESRLLRKEVELVADVQTESVYSKQDVSQGDSIFQHVGAEPCDETPPGLSSVEMEVDKGVLNHTASSKGEEELVKNQTGPKAGKWKR
ncbi:hypothetical protein EZV62_001788 [Acer yangbiense]|uniref:DUF4283 domain-containing protein n=1 Tax=Acer yangbiense TaxID=1000413 RepID=A0A5C7IVW0_9ROSI|nr:hypothetical protein EZV62_001788 [Acer yangbiense]